MLVKSICRSCLVSLVFIVCAFPAWGQDKADWFRVDIPPVYILKDGEPAGGYGELSMHFVMENLPQYAHTVSTMNLAQGMEAMKQGKPLCFATLLENSERAKFIEFSIPAQLVLPLYLIVRSEDVSLYDRYLNSSGQIDLDRLLTQGDKVLGVADGRSYSSSIDEVILRHAQGPNVHTSPTVNVSLGLLQLFLEKRVDCILEFPVTMGYLLMTQHNSEQGLSYIPIQGLPPFFQTHFAAPKNKWGKRIISQIDAILRKYRTSDEFVDFYTAWLPGPTKERYRQIVRETFVTP